MLSRASGLMVHRREGRRRLAQWKKGVVQALVKKQPIYWLLLALGLLLIGWSVGQKPGFLRSGQLSHDSTDEVYGPLKVGERFIAKYPNFHRVGVKLRSYGRREAGDLIFHLRPDVSSSSDLATVTMGASQVKDNALNIFAFPPIKDSANKTFYFFLESPNSSPGNAILVLSSSRDTYGGGTKYLDGRPQVGDLAFLVDYSLSPADVAQLLLQRLSESKPSLLGSKIFYTSLFVVYVALVVSVLYRVCRWKVDL